MAGGGRGILDELKRRKVVRVAIVYGAVAYAVLQFADLVVDPLGLPDWTLTFLILAAAAGFPIALLLAWALELTPEGVRRTPSEAAPPASGDASRRVAAGAGRWLSRKAIAGALAFVAIGLALGWLARGADPRREADPAGDAAHGSIAVLPFADQSPAGDMAYFGDGVAEEILNVLAHVPDLRVAGRTSSFTFRNRSADAAAIAAALDVETVLDGSIRVSGDRLRVTAQLIRASDQSELWANSYDRSLSGDIFEIQEDIAASVASALRLQLGTGGRAALEGGTRNERAYERFLLGREAWRLRSEEGMRNAERLLRDAVALDPGYADAWAALSEALTLAWTNGISAHDVDYVLREGEAAAARSIELAPDLSSGWRAMAMVRWTDVGIQNVVATGELLEKARGLNPSDAWAAYWLSHVQASLGDIEGAMSSARAATRLDPLAIQIAVGEAQVHVAAGEWEAAARSARAVLSLDPSHISARHNAAIFGLFAGDAGAADLVAGVGTEGETAAVALAHALRGERAAVDSMAALRTPGIEGIFPAMLWARAHELTGDLDAAMVEIDVAIDRFPAQVWLIVGWPEGSLRSDPRFFAAIERAGFGHYWRDAF